MKHTGKLALMLFAACVATAQAGEIDGKAVVGGALGGAAGAAVGSAVGGRTGAVVGAGVGGAAGAAIATHSSKPQTKVVEREVVHVHDHDCGPPGHCKHGKHGKKGKH